MGRSAFVVSEMGGDSTGDPGRDRQGIGRRRAPVSAVDPSCVERVPRTDESTASTG